MGLILVGLTIISVSYDNVLTKVITEILECDIPTIKSSRSRNTNSQTFKQVVSKPTVDPDDPLYMEVKLKESSPEMLLMRKNMENCSLIDKEIIRFG